MKIVTELTDEQIIKLFYEQKLQFVHSLDVNVTNTANHAKKELDIFFANEPDSQFKNMEKEILALCEKFGQSGQSGGSNGYSSAMLSEIIKKLCRQETIAPIMGTDDEWMLLDYDADLKYQNIREAGIFKNADGRSYYIDAMIKRTEKSGDWSGSFWKSKEDYLTGDRSLMISKSAFIKSFPFTPKTFYIEVDEEEVAPDDWEMYMVNPEQLDLVAEYYDLK